MNKPNKEEIYDDILNPLVAKIIALCQEHGIAMFASFAIPTPEDADLACTTCLPDGDGNTPDYLQRARRGAMSSGGESFAMTITRAA